MPAPAQPQTVCILGFHRSGTSLTARIANLLGVPLGDESELLPAAETDNPRGYWEPRWMNQLNDELLAALGTSWWEPLPAAPGWETSDEIAPLRQRAQDLVAAKLGHTSFRAVKDPRLSLTLPFWRPLLGEVRCLVCLRNPIDAVASLQRRPEPTRSVRAWGELWLEYTARALHETRDDRRLLVFYEDYFQDAERAVSRLASFLGIPVEERSERVARALPEISSELRRHVTTARELAADPAVPAATRLLYLSLRAGHALRGTGPEGGDPAEHLAEAIERAAPDVWWVSRNAGAYEHATAELAAVRSELADRSAELVARDDELNAVRNRARNLDELLAHAHQEAAAAHASLDQIRASRSWRLTAPLRRMARWTRTDSASAA